MRNQLIIFIAAFAFIAFYLINNTKAPTTPNPNLSSNSGPTQGQAYDYFMTAVNDQHLDLEGNVQYHLIADRLTHYPNPDISNIEAPDITIFRESKAPWRITAMNGRLLIDTESMLDRVELSDNVVIHSVDKDGQPLDIYTEFLILYPDTKRLSTDREVRFLAPGIENTSLGMTADLNINEINFLANVRGQYE